VSEGLGAVLFAPKRRFMVGLRWCMQEGSSGRSGGDVEVVYCTGA
jgi:hypothetical protein